MDPYVQHALVKIIGNREKAYNEGYEKLKEANSRKIKELEEKREEALRLHDECIQERNEILFELERRGITSCSVEQL
jgi:hypothetical protein